MNTSTVRLYCGDCLDILPEIKNGSIDLAVFSPPYNVSLKYGENDLTDDSRDPGEYKGWADIVMRRIADTIAVGGRVCVEIGGSGINLPLSWIWQDAAFLSGLGLFSEIVIPHRKTNPCAWGSWLRADNVRTIPNFHSLFVFYKETQTKTGKDDTTISGEEFSEWTRGVWNINYSVGKTKEHPATFPVALPERCIRLFGHKGDVVIDPFMGSGSTGIACINSGRHFVGIEIDPVYYAMAEERIKQEQLQMRMFNE